MNYSCPENDLFLVVIRSEVCRVLFSFSRLKFIRMAKIFSFIHPSLFVGLSSRTTLPPPNPNQPSGKQKFAHNSPPLPPRPQNNVYYPVIVFIFFAETLWFQLLLFFLQPSEHHAVGLEDLFEWSKNFDAPLHWRVDPAIPRNCKVRSRDKKKLEITL